MSNQARDFPKQARLWKFRAQYLSSCRLLVARWRRAARLNQCEFFEKSADHQVSGQLPGIDVCPKHSVFFENSTGQVKNAIYNADLFTAEQHIPDISVRDIDIDDEIHRLLLQLAKDAEWLLSQKNLCVGYEFLNNSYTHILGEKGYLLQASKINLKL